VTPTAKRAAVEWMVQAHRLSRAKACRIVGYSRSACYQPAVDWAAKDAPVIDALNTIIAKRPRWGFWKCFKRLRKDGKPWNHKRVHRVYCDMKLNMKRRTKKRAITRERQPLGTASEVNHVWALDFMRDTMYDGRPFRTLNVIDEGNREALCIECGMSISSARLLRTMEQLVEAYGTPQAIRLDNVLNAIGIAQKEQAQTWLSKQPKKQRHFAALPNGHFHVLRRASIHHNEHKIQQ
jgi:putative transposase